MERLEKAIEGDFGEKICQWAIENNINLAYVKFTGAKGWPDRILTWGFSEDGPAHTIWIEWKRPGEHARPMQVHIHKILRNMGHDVRVFDDYRIALDTFKEEVRATLRADQGDEAHNVGGRGAPVPATRKGKDVSGAEGIQRAEEVRPRGRVTRARTTKGGND